MEDARRVRWPEQATDRAAQRRPDDGLERQSLMIQSFPKAKVPLEDLSDYRDWFRNALIEGGITPWFPSKSNRKVPIPHDCTLYG